MSTSQRTIKLEIRYDGSNYCGWQMQDNGPSIQGLIEKAIEKIVGSRLPLIGAARTDAGVHALGQAASFHYEGNLPLRAFHLGVNALLPQDIQILAAYEMPADFNARQDAREKIYDYYFTTATVFHPLLHRYSWQVAEKLNLAAMHAALPHLIGKHDFSSFCAAGSDVLSKERTILAADLITLDGLQQQPLFADTAMYCIRIRGNGFLKHMVRNIVGTVMEVGRGKLQPLATKDILLKQDRRTAGPTAPAHGLFLMETKYAAV